MLDVCGMSGEKKRWIESNFSATLIRRIYVCMAVLLSALTTVSKAARISPAMFGPLLFSSANDLNVPVLLLADTH